MSHDPVPFVDLVRVQAPLRADLRAAFDRVLGHGGYVLGREVARFEASLATWLGAPEAVGVSSGTDALLSSFLALGAQPGDEVVLTPFTFISSATSVMRAGFRPVFADLAPGSFHPGPAQLEAAIGPRTRAILVVHLFGEPLDTEPICALCSRHGLALVEDCAQAIGARHGDGTHVGLSGRFGILSFFPAKNLGALGDGGAVYCADPDDAATIRAIRQHGCVVKYRHDRLGGNFRLDALQAALLDAMLPALDGWITARTDNARFYARTLGPIAADHPERLTLHSLTDGHAWNQYVLRLHDRDGARARLAEAGIGHAVYYPSALHQQPALAPARPPARLPEAEQRCAEVLAIPIYPGLREDERARVAEVVASIASC